MTAAWPSTRVAVLLGLGAADLCALNIWVLPNLIVRADDEVQIATMAATDPQHEVPAAAAAQAAEPSPNASPNPIPSPIPSPIPIPNPNPIPSPSPIPNLNPIPTPSPTSASALPSTPAASRIDELPTVVRFMTGTWWVGRSDREQLAALAQSLRDGDAVIEIDGYADETGPGELNRRISQSRADALAEVLAQAGLDRARIVIRAHGEAGPLEGDGASDRRAELRIRRTR